MIKFSQGKIIELPAGNIRDHERRTARALASTGMIVEFIPASDKDFTKSPDVFMGGVLWEMKSPKTDKLTQIEKNLKRANRQSSFIIIDSQRVKQIPDKKIQAFLINRFKASKSVKRLLFVNRKREVIDISRFI